jgi:ubiquinol-cytochrome c reductase iron-sulfur subunit
MSADGVDTSRRRFLTVSTSVVGGLGVAAALVPFVSSMNPSARAEAAGAPVKVDISKLDTGKMVTVTWRGKPVWVVHRTSQNVEDLPGLDGKLVDPDSAMPEQPEYANNKHRSINPEILVLVGVCTHLGCTPTYRPDMAPADLGADWKGGFFCPCHGSKYDLAGRVYKGVPAPKNLEVPPYQFLSDTLLLIGDDKKGAA